MDKPTNKEFNSAPFLKGGGEMGQLIREYPWETTSLGSTDGWPMTLLFSISQILNSKFPMFIFWGTDLISFYNDAYRPSLGINGKHPNALGQKGAECWEEIWPTIYPIIQNILNGGESILYKDFFLPIFRNGKLDDVYLTFCYSSIINEEDLIGGIMVTCFESTERIQGQLKIQEALQKVETSEKNIENLIRQAPVAICLSLGENHLISIINKLMLQLIGRTEEIINKPLFDAIPEGRNQGYEELMSQVYNTGITFKSEEMQAQIIRNNKLEEIFVNLVYEPYKNFQGEIIGIIAVATEVSEAVYSKKELERLYEQIRLSKEAAELGTFDVDLVNNTMEWDTRCRILFGIYHNEKVDYEKNFVMGLHPEDRPEILEIIAKCFNKSLTNAVYDVEFRTVGFETGKITWVHAKGQVFFDKKDAPIRFIGSVLDITEQKQIEQRKNDFISMVSHELKTPLTVMSGYTQILKSTIQPNLNPTLNNSLLKVEKQIKKMSVLVKGFLNVSKLEMGKLNLNCNYFSIINLISDIIEDVNYLHHKNIIELIQPTEDIEIYADKDKLENVITNLIGNAIKYSKPENILIRITINSNLEEVVVQISDNGLGISKEEIPNLFERYYRIENKYNKHISGFGIGLYLCNEIIQLHKGKIWVESILNQGSDFYFSIPNSKN